jgi:hypothetical protein
MTLYKNSFETARQLTAPVSAQKPRLEQALMSAATSFFVDK